MNIDDPPRPLALEVQEEKGKKLKDFEAALPGNADIEVGSDFSQTWRGWTYISLYNLYSYIIHYYESQPIG